MTTPGRLAAEDRSVANLRNQVYKLSGIAFDLLDEGMSVEHATLELGRCIVRGGADAYSLAQVLAAAAVQIAAPPQPTLPPLTSGRDDHDH